MNRARDNIVARFFPGLRTKLKGQRSYTVLVVLCLILASVVIVSADKGAVEINPRQIFAIILKLFGAHSAVDFTPLQESTLIDIRLPRIALRMLVGAVLGISGAAMLKNGKIVALRTPEKVLAPEAIQETFAVKVSVVKHPHFDCPLIVWRDFD